MTNKNVSKSFIKSILQINSYSSIIVLKHIQDDLSSLLLINSLIQSHPQALVVSAFSNVVPKTCDIIQPSNFANMAELFLYVEKKLAQNDGIKKVIFPSCDDILLNYCTEKMGLKDTVSIFTAHLHDLKRKFKKLTIFVDIAMLTGSSNNPVAETSFIAGSLEHACTSSISCIKFKFDSIRNIYSLFLSAFHRRGMVYEETVTENIDPYKGVSGVLSETGTYEIDASDFKLERFISDIHKKKVNVSSTETEQPKSSFNLNLSESEEKARADVVLPYKRTEEVKQIDTGPGAKGDSQITYLPDEFDDLDDDDPDDDLDI